MVIVARSLARFVAGATSEFAPSDTRWFRAEIELAEIAVEKGVLDRRFSTSSKLLEPNG
jgi:hypothetical protein